MHWDRQQQRSYPCMVGPSLIISGPPQCRNTITRWTWPQSTSKLTPCMHDGDHGLLGFLVLMRQWLSKSDLAAEVRHQPAAQGGTSATAGSQVTQNYLGRPVRVIQIAMCGVRRLHALAGMPAAEHLILPWSAAVVPRCVLLSLGWCGAVQSVDRPYCGRLAHVPQQKLLECTFPLFLLTV